MIRIWLSFSVSGLVLIVGTYAACVQSENFDRAAELHELQLESDWHLRRATQLRVQLERYRFEFGAPEHEGAISPAGPVNNGAGSLGSAHGGAL